MMGAAVNTARTLFICPWKFKRKREKELIKEETFSINQEQDCGQS